MFTTQKGLIQLKSPISSGFRSRRWHPTLPSGPIVQIHVQHSTTTIKIGLTYSTISWLRLWLTHLSLIRTLLPWRPCSVLMWGLRNWCHHLLEGTFSPFLKQRFALKVLFLFQALSDEANELLPIFNKTSTKIYKASVPTGDWSNQVKHPKKHKPAVVIQ